MRTRELFTSRTSGHDHGPITRLMSPSDLGEILKPFVFLDAVNIKPGGKLGFDWHPHSGIATVTVHFEGASWAEESNGAKHDVPAGGAEWVQAGEGVWHRGGPAESAENIKAFQLWLALGNERELLPAISEYYSPAELPTDGPVRVILGEFDGFKSNVPSPEGITYIQVSLSEKESTTLTKRPHEEVRFIALLEGELIVSDETGNIETLSGPEIAVINAMAGDIYIEANQEAKLVYGAAPEHPHALCLGNYSVHTSPDTLAAGKAGIKRIRTELFDQNPK